MTTYQKLFLIILVCSSLLLILGLNSHLYLGDEVFHYRFARQCYEAGKRVVFDPLYDSGHPPGYFYVIEPLWHFGLALIWKLIGKVSFYLAQIYHTIYYALLIFFSFLLGRTLYNEKIGLASSFIVATIPMMVVFGILFYLDVPVAMFTVLFFLLFFKERYWEAGIIIGLMYLTKRNAMFFVPCIPLMVILKYKKDFFRIFKTHLILFIPSSIIILSDLIWRHRNIGALLVQPYSQTWAIVRAVKSEIPNIMLILETNLQSSKLYNPRSIQNSILLNPTDMVKYLGAVFFILLFLYFIKKRFEKKDIFLLMPVGCYTIFYLYFFGFKGDIRYLIPIIPLACILVSKSFLCIKNNIFKKFIISLCILQFLFSAIFIYQKRQITREEEKAFKFIRENIKDNKLILYPESIILEKTEKRAIWSSLFFWPNLFWGKLEDKKIIIDKFDLGYIIIKHTRVYDDSKVRHLGGYPKSFVEELPHLPFVKCIYKNNVISIWQIDRTLTKIKKVN